MKRFFLVLMLGVAASANGLSNLVDIVPSVEVGSPSLVTASLSAYLFPFNFSDGGSIWKIDKSKMTFGFVLTQTAGFDLLNLPGFLTTSLAGIVLDDSKYDDFRMRLEFKAGRLLLGDFRTIDPRAFYGGLIEVHPWFLFVKMGLFINPNGVESGKYIPVLAIGMKFLEAYY